MAWTLHEGDCIDVLRDYPVDYFDAVLTDPPYGLRFMGKRWDYDVPSADFWREVLPALKPGAPVLAFGGTRTYHRLVCAIEDAGFTIRDTLFWCYGTGFPKSLDLGKATGDEAFAGYGTALKPALEPVCLAMKPLDGTFAHNALEWGVGGLNIDGCRIGNAGGGTTCPYSPGPCEGHGNRLLGKTYHANNGERPGEAGRWPANLLLDEDAAAMLDAQSGDRPGGRPVPSETDSRPIWGNAERQAFAGYNDTGGASRFFFVAKPDRGERDFGCEELELRSPGELTGREDDSAGLRSPRAGAGRTGGGRNLHTTVKPITLAKYLATLILPPSRGTPRRLLVPFAGSGSEMIGALRAGWDSVEGIERESDYVRIAQSRLQRWESVQDYLEPRDVVPPPPPDPRQAKLF